MRARVEAVTIEATRIAARVRVAGGADAATLAVATALRLFARYPVVDRFTLTGHGADLEVSRAQAEAWLAPDGLAAVNEPAGWAEAVARAVTAFRSGA